MLEGGKGGVGPPALVQVATEVVIEAGGAERVALLDQLDRLLCELDRARCHSRLAGQLGRPGAELGGVDCHELGRVRHSVPQPERALQVRVSLRQAEDGLRLARRLDRRDERLLRATCSGPMRRELRGAEVAPRASSSASRACNSSRSPGSSVA